MDKLKLGIKVIRTLKNWRTYFKDFRKRLKEKEVIYEFRDGTRLKLRTQATSGNSCIRAFNEVFIHEEYNRREGFKLKPTDVVVDVGGFIGDFTTYAAKRAKQVYVFEPIPENFKFVQDNIKLNNFQNVEAYNKGLGNKTEKITINLEEGELGSCSEFDSLCHHPRKVVCDFLSLKDFIKENKIEKIDFLKLDCEGGEYNILYEADKEDLKKVQKIAMEYHDVDEKDRNWGGLQSFLLENGFEVHVDVGTDKYGTLYAWK